MCEEFVPHRVDMHKRKYCRWIPQLMQSFFQFPRENKQINKQPFNSESMNGKTSRHPNKILFEWCMIRARRLHFAEELTVVFVGSLGLTGSYVNVPPRKWVHTASCTRTAHTIKVMYFTASSIFTKRGYPLSSLNFHAYINRTKFKTQFWWVNK